VEAALISCYSRNLMPYGKDRPELLEASVKVLALYPKEPAVMNVLLLAILDVFSDQIYWERLRNPQLVLDEGQLIKAKAGDIQVKGKKASDWVDFGITAMNLCAGKAVASAAFGTALPKKYIDCDSADFVGISLDPAGPWARDPAEAWFIMEFQRVDAPDLQCTLNYEGVTYAYSYPGQYQFVFTFKNIHTLQVASKKTFLSTPPVCGFRTCTLNKANKTASYIGGEGGMAAYMDELNQWMKDGVR
jgi:hypothetical protein